MQAQKRKRYHKDSTPTDDILTLIQLVRQNPALYNYKLQPNQRRRSDVLNGWAQIAAQIGNKYTVEECRRKWKNLRDTYHQYRLRKPKLGVGLSKWRYAKELEFLSNIYQPKLKSNRYQCLISEMESKYEHHTNITLVNDDAAEFILTAYEHSVSDDVHAIDGSHDGLSHVEDVEEIVKNEHVASLDSDGPGVAEVDYEEVCLYEEAPNAPSVDCETIIPGSSQSSSGGTKEFEYISSEDFCMPAINTHLAAGGTVIGTTKLKITGANNIVTTEPETSNMLSETDTCTTTIAPSLVHVQTFASRETIEELDLFFDFLKKKIQRFSKEDITAIQVEFLNCVLHREAENLHKNNMPE